MKGREIEGEEKKKTRFSQSSLVGRRMSLEEIFVSYS